MKIILPAFLVLYSFVYNIKSCLCTYTTYYIDVALFEDGEHQHPSTSLRAKEAYYNEVFTSLSRRLDLLGVGRFVFLRHNIHTLSQAHSAAVFQKGTKTASLNDIYKNVKPILHRDYAAVIRGKDIIIVVTKRSLTSSDGIPNSGFAIKGSMCTEQNIALVPDDGVFLAVNKLVKVIVHAIGVDVDGVGAAKRCYKPSYLMGSGSLKQPFAFSSCTQQLVAPALRNLRCVKKETSSTPPKPLPAPPKVYKSQFCAAHRSTSCGEEDCYVFCCKHLREDIYSAPDGVECKSDRTGLNKRRCVNGKCKNLR
ncbi:uncharacterized protein LOC142589014 [Dermacentor variabilis]|uniref:uncharacterized protein LOC142589014 n=1 Tax=Dermacentor variabilis TaxID=34621 RepID=UPI003F5C108C